MAGEVVRVRAGEVIFDDIPAELHRGVGQWRFIRDRHTKQLWVEWRFTGEFASASVDLNVFDQFGEVQVALSMGGDGITTPVLAVEELRAFARDLPQIIDGLAEHKLP